jgi:hypothetical protein
MTRLFYILLFSVFSNFIFGQTANVQVIHNALNAPLVDIYINGNLAFDDIAFRSATSFESVPAGTPISIAIASDTSTTAASAFVTFNVTFTANSNNAITAYGIRGDLATPFAATLDRAALRAASSGTNTALSLFHGSPNAPAIDLEERVLGPIISDFAYEESTGYLNLVSNNPANPIYYFDIYATGATGAADTILFTYRVDLRGFAGKAGRLFASGLLGNATTPFGLFVAFDDGQVIELPREDVARVQVIQNSLINNNNSSPAVDIWLNNAIRINDLAYRAASPFFYVPAGPTGFDLGAAPSTTTTAASRFLVRPLKLKNGGNYTIALNGLQQSTATPPVFHILPNALLSSPDTNLIAVRVLHGVPGAPNVDALSYLADTTRIIRNLAYGSFTNYIGLPEATVILDVTATGQRATVVGTNGGNFAGLGGVAGTVFASGRPGGTPAFGLFLAATNGQVVPLPSWARAQIVHNAVAPGVDVYYGTTTPSRIVDSISLREATPVFLLPAGSASSLGLKPQGSASTVANIVSFPLVALSNGTTNYLIITGDPASATSPLALSTSANGRFRGNNPANVELAFYHGSYDAPAVDIKVNNGPALFSNVSYRGFGTPISPAAGNYVVDVTRTGNPAALATYRADLSTLGGRSALVWASGYFLGTSNPRFQPWVALANGTTFPLQTAVNTIEKDPAIEYTDVVPNPSSDNASIRISLNESRDLKYRVRDLTGRIVFEKNLGVIQAGEFIDNVSVADYVNGLYIVELYSNKGMSTIKMMVQK